MPRFINDSCIGCGSCAAACPVECIKEGDIYVIDADACIDCGACQDGCPVAAIEEKQLIKKHQLMAGLRKTVILKNV